jgi:hypothetical protein
MNGTIMYGSPWFCAYCEIGIRKATDPTQETKYFIEVSVELDEFFVREHADVRWRNMHDLVIEVSPLMKASGRGR